MLLGSIAVISGVLAAVICGCAGSFGSSQWLWVLPLGFAGCFLALAALAFLLIWAACAAVRLDKPQEQDSPFYRRLTYLAAEAILAILQMRVETRGLENTPQEGRFLLVCNHLHDLDPVTLMHFFRKSQLAFISKRENTSMFLVGKLMHKLMCQLINRENDREALKTILKCINILQEDKASIAVFPEGYTSVDRMLHPFRPGVFKIAQRTGVPIVVCTVQNTFDILPNFYRLRSTDVELHLLGVIQPEEYAGKTTVEISDRVHAMMAADLGPDKVLPPQA